MVAFDAVEVIFQSDELRERFLKEMPPDIQSAEAFQALMASGKDDPEFMEYMERLSESIGGTFQLAVNDLKSSVKWVISHLRFILRMLIFHDATSGPVHDHCTCLSVLVISRIPWCSLQNTWCRLNCAQ